MEKIRNTVSKIVSGFNYIGMAACFVTVFIVAFDIIIRKITKQSVSIPGSNELSQYLLVVMCMLAIPTLQIKKGHVWVNMFVMKFPDRFRNIWMGVVMLIETVVAAAFCYGCFANAATLANRTTDILHLPHVPFTYLCSFGFLELTVLFLIDTIQYFIDAFKKKEAAE